MGYSIFAVGIGYVILSEYHIANLRFQDMAAEDLKSKSLDICQPKRRVLSWHMTVIEVFIKDQLLILKGALDKYNIYLFMPNSIEDFKSNQYQNFQLVLPMRFHFMMYFVNGIMLRVSGYCIVHLLKSTLKNRNC